jgi:protein-glutamine gamma-glutamyltransferase
MSFEKQFQLISYLAVFCGFFALWVSGTFGIVENTLFVGVMLLAWRLEGSRWQISERVGTTLIVLALPIYYLLWRFRFFDLSNTEMMLPGILARLILSLTAIKLLQKKSDRDWMFLYLMAFFELLLAAGLSISIGYLLAFGAFIFVMACTVILFQIRKTTFSIAERSPAKPALPIDLTGIGLPFRRAVLASAVMIILISAVAVPTFFLLPRVSGAGIGGNLDSVSTVSGFSDSVRLGGIGRIQQNDAVVMRVRIENDAPNEIHWRGVALDTFDGQYWSRSKTALREPKTRNDRDLFQVDVARRQEGLTLQTVYLEPLDSPVIFGLYRMIGIQGNFNVLFRDAAGAITFQRTGERVSYKVLSDTAEPRVEKLRADRSPYSADLANYLQLPKNLDERIVELADKIAVNSSNRYDIAVATERYLQNSYGYTLEQKASGTDPLSDFLFNVREGHCEYFATAMAIMLRTQGIAARVVNGFQRGEYNDTADVYVVRQRNAHSWVEVYFPESDSWVTFDPTPAAGQNNVGAVAGISDRIRKYMEAIETFWIQYFVAFDNQEQRSLFVSVRNGMSDYQNGLSSGWNVIQAEIVEWWKRVRGDKGLASSLGSLGWGALMLAVLGTALLLFVWLYRKVVKLKVWRILWNRVFARQTESIVEFYDRMQHILESKGLSRLQHQTPLEFAFEIGMPEAVNITQRYNSVRFGNEPLSGEDAEQIENWLVKLEGDSIAKGQKPTVS